ncbi:hypothetical protein MKX01_008828 [Papaver californicum]|nr:hypothetical protein MKX01_008828 [Papaver californicum]
MRNRRKSPHLSQARQEKEKESRDADDGFVVVYHHRGRKKTTDSESGTVLGSVSQAAVLDKMGKKKNKEVGIAYYTFQRRDAQRNGRFIVFASIGVASGA